MLKKSLAAAVLAAVMLPAGAAAGDWGPHDLLETSGLVAPAAGPFLDTYSFALGGLADVASALGAGGGAMVASYGLWSNPDTVVGNGDDALLAAWGANTGVHLMPALGAGSYFYGVSGLAGVGAVYALASATAVAAAVPEAQGWAMLLAGLGAVGFIAARRRLG